jgi:hypothetical protein
MKEYICGKIFYKKKKKLEIKKNFSFSIKFLSVTGENNERDRFMLIRNSSLY